MENVENLRKRMLRNRKLLHRAVKSENLCRAIHTYIFDTLLTTHAIKVICEGRHLSLNDSDFFSINVKTFTIFRLLR